MTREKEKIEKNKLFGRAAYHIAIAYHIHLEKIKKNGNTEVDPLDPTFFSKRLKERSRT